MDCSMTVSLSSTNCQSLLRSMIIESVMLSNHPIRFCPFLILLSTFPSFRVFSNDTSLCIRWPKCWSFSFSNSLSSECSGLISFRVDGFESLQSKGTLKSLLLHHNLKASTVWYSNFLMIQLFFIIHPYITTGKTVALTS